jgi:hypothetical protein
MMGLRVGQKWEAYCGLKKGTQPRCIQNPIGTWREGSAVVRPTWHRCGIKASQACKTFFGLGVHVHGEPDIAAEFVGEDVERRLEDAGDGGGCRIRCASG